MVEQAGLLMLGQAGQEVLEQPCGLSDWGWSLLILCPLGTDQGGNGLSRKLDKAWFAETGDKRRPWVPWPASSELWIWAKLGWNLESLLSICLNTFASGDLKFRTMIMKEEPQMGLIPHFAWVPRAGVGGCASHSGDYTNHPMLPPLIKGVVLARAESWFSGGPEPGACAQSRPGLCLPSAQPCPAGVSCWNSCSQMLPEHHPHHPASMHWKDGAFS